MLSSARQRRSSSSILHSAIENLESRTLFSAGLLDTTFNLIGKQTARYSDTTSDGVSVRFQADHKAIVVGDVQNGTKDAFISRWNEDGTPDTTYGVDTTKHATFLDLGKDEIATDVDIESDGKAVVCGFTGTLSGSSPTGKMFVARYNTDGSLDTTFDSSGAGDSGSMPGVRVISLGTLSGASGITVDPSTGRITVVGISANLASGSGGIAFVFLKPDGSFGYIRRRWDGTYGDESWLGDHRRGDGCCAGTEWAFLCVGIFGQRGSGTVWGDIDLDVSGGGV